MRSLGSLRLECWLLTALVACGGSESAGRAERSGADVAVPAAPAPAESLALRAPGGVEVWFTLARPARDDAGAPCVERALEIRDGTRRTPVPLLYTRDTPRLANDSTIRARLWTHCRPGPTYLVNLRTGQPVPAPR